MASIKSKELNTFKSLPDCFSQEIQSRYLVYRSGNYKNCSSEKQRQVEVNCLYFFFFFFFEGSSVQSLEKAMVNHSSILA